MAFGLPSDIGEARFVFLHEVLARFQGDFKSLDVYRSCPGHILDVDAAVDVLDVDDTLGETRGRKDITGKFDIRINLIACRGIGTGNRDRRRVAVGDRLDGMEIGRLE